jgi:hypothetical protein
MQFGQLLYSIYQYYCKDLDGRKTDRKMQLNITLSYVKEFFTSVGFVGLLR